MEQAPAFRALLEAAAGAPLQTWAALESRVAVRRFEAGATLFAQGVAAPSVYVVRTGLIKLVYLDDAGDEWIKSFVPEGQYFASLSALAPGGESAFAAMTLEPSQVEQLAWADIERQASGDLAWARAVTALVMAFAARKERRERELLTLTPEQRYLAFSAEHPALERRIPQKDLARYLGVTPVGLNRIIRRVRELGGDTRSPSAGARSL